MCYITTTLNYDESKINLNYDIALFLHIYFLH